MTSPDRAFRILLITAPALLALGWLLGPGWRVIAARVDAQVCRVGAVEWGETS